jgi:hypothetical protein
MAQHDTKPQQKLAREARNSPCAQHQQVRGLLWLAAIVILLSIARAGLHTAFPRGWWRLW